MTLTGPVVVERHRGRDPNAPPAHFLGRSLDDDPDLLERSYRLRYEVYCLERKFLPAEHYPLGLESDQYDRHAIHVGAVAADGELAGTARGVRPSEIGLPLFDHCRAFAHETEFHGGNPRLLEVGRLVVGRNYRRRRGDVVSGVAKAKSGPATAYHGAERRRVGEDAFMTIQKALYEETKRIGATHWLTGMEEPLRRQLAEQGFPFRAFGPESDYFGVITPYQMSLNDLDAVILSGRFPALDAFAVVLESNPSTGGT